jgi:hypothetical protein
MQFFGVMRKMLNRVHDGDMTRSSVQLDYLAVLGHMPACCDAAAALAAAAAVQRHWQEQ